MFLSQVESLPTSLGLCSQQPSSAASQRTCLWLVVLVSAPLWHLQVGLIPPVSGGREAWGRLDFCPSTQHSKLSLQQTLWAPQAHPWSSLPPVCAVWQPGSPQRAQLDLSPFFPDPSHKAVPGVVCEDLPRAALSLGGARVGSCSAFSLCVLLHSALPSLGHGWPATWGSCLL